MRFAAIYTIPADKTVAYQLDRTRVILDSHKLTAFTMQTQDDNKEWITVQEPTKDAVIEHIAAVTGALNGKC